MHVSGRTILTAIMAMLLFSGMAASTPRQVKGSELRQAVPVVCNPSWSVVYSPSPGISSNYLYGVSATSSSDAWAVGDYYNGSVYETLTEHWDGSSWSVAPSPSPGTPDNSLSGVSAISSSDVWTVGGYRNSSGYYQTLTEHWDGSSWSVVPSPSPGTYGSFLGGVTAISPSDVWAVGSYNNGGGLDQTLTEHWNGSSWSVVPSPNVGTSSNYLYGVSAISPNDVWAVGSYNNGGGLDQTLTEHWNGSSWSVVSSPSPGISSNYLYGVSATSSSDVWAVGYNGSVYQTLTEHWDGSSWSVAPSPNFGTNGNSLSGVSAISSSDVWAVGGYHNSSGYYQSLTEHWDGSSWSVVPSPSLSAYDNHLYGVTAISSSNVWAVGSYSYYSGNPYQTLVEHYSTSLCPTSTPTLAPTNTIGPTNSPTLTNTPLPTSTRTSTPTPTNTPLPTSTPTPMMCASYGTSSRAASNQGLTSAPQLNSSGKQPAILANLILDDGSPEAYFSHGSGNISYPAIWLNRFSISALNYPLHLNQISILFPNAQQAGIDLTGRSINLLVYLDCDANNNPNNATKVLQLPTTVAVADGITFSSYAVDEFIGGPGDLYIGFSDTFNSGGFSPRSRLTSEDTSSSQARSWLIGRSGTQSPDYDHLANNDQYGTIDSFGFPGNWMIRAAVDTNNPQTTPTIPPLPSPTPPCPVPFTDINGNIFYGAITNLYCRGVVNGTDASHFSPAGTSTRGQFAKVVVLGFGLPSYTPAAQDFSDVPASYFAYAFIESGYHAGILSGYDANTCYANQHNYPCYLPNQPITRGQLTKLVVNAAHYSLVTPGTQTFIDVPSSNVFYLFIETAHAKGIINGYPGQIFRPNNNIQRDQMCQIVYEAITTP